ncbi:micro-fibrillar-associated protein 1 [Pavlovales sp. CCMP2436]|nr:micro-fibrillar-associated protein 1 [Pavlovales sp. CCMP2436]
MLLKPVFVPKAQRETVLAQQVAEKAEEEAERRRIEKLASRRKDTLELVVESARREDAGDVAAEEVDMPDDADDEDDMGEYEAWKLRELKRVKAERDRREEMEKEKAELERRRGLSEEEKTREDEARLAKQKEKPEGDKRKFLQKYFHKGAFFQEEDAKGNPMLGDIMKRDFGEATGMDRTVDKSSLPKPMQVKKFGFRSAVKWTHLSAEDTTNREDIMRARDDQRGRGGGRGGGMGGGMGGPSRHGGAGSSGRPEFSRPTSKKPRTAE